jgi:integrase
MSLFRRANSPYWYTEIQVKGVRVVRSTGATERRDALKYEKQLREDLKRQSGGPQREAMTLDQACGKYWLDHGQTLKWAVDWHLKKIVAFFGTELLLCEMGNKHVDELAQERMREGGPIGVNRTLAVLRQVHRMAGRKWDEPTKAVDWSGHMKREPKERVRWITPGEAGKLLDELRRVGADHIALAVEWSLYTGCRRSETFQLRWSDVDLERGCASVAGKTGRRTVWLSAEVRAVLARCPNSSETVFNGTNHRKLFEAAVAAVPLEDFTWHDLRHAHATWLRQAGAPLEIVQRSLGHTLITTTGRYAHVDDTEVKDALRKLPSLSVTPESSNVVHIKRKG